MTNKNRLSYDKAVSAAFTGHRYYDFSNKEAIRERLTTAILASYENGIRNFISGFATGFDLMAAQVVHSMRPLYPEMLLTAAIPFPGQADRYKPCDQSIYAQLMADADEVIVLSDHYYRRCFLNRDEFMVDNSSLIIAYYDGREKGGTYFTVRKAKSSGIPIVNVF